MFGMAHVAMMAARLEKAMGAARFVVSADESIAPLKTAPFETVVYNDDFSNFGLPRFPHRTVLWYNEDYPLYVLRRRFPSASHYAMVQYDVAVNIDLFRLLRHAADMRVHDLLGKTVVERVVVYNRMEFRERCVNMVVSGSTDGVQWTLRGGKLDGELFGGFDGRPFEFWLSAPFPARFVRG
jgi:hypothetical protein